MIHQNHKFKLIFKHGFIRKNITSAFCAFKKALNTNVLFYKPALIAVAGLLVPGSMLVLGAFSPSAQAQTPNTTINFQARLLNVNGQVVPDGNYHIEFKLYNDISAGATAQGVCTGNCVWMETRTTGNLVRVANGYISVNLGSVTAFGSTIPWSQNLYVTMRIGGSAGAASWDTEMTNAGNRMKLSAVPLALVANNVRSADRTSAASDAIAVQSGTTTTSGNSGNISIQTGNAATTAGNIALNVGTSGSGTPSIDIGTTNSTTARTITVGGTTQTGTITVGQSTAAQTLTLLSTANTGAQIINIANGNTAANSTVNILSGTGTAGAGTLNLGNNQRVTTIAIGNVAPSAARTTTIAGGNSAVVDTINIGSGNTTVANGKSINIGAGTPTGAGTNTIVLGTITNASTTTIRGGTGSGAIALNVGSGGTTSINNSGVANTVQIGTTTGAVTQTINIGNNATASSTSNIAIGSTVAGTTTLQGLVSMTGAVLQGANALVFEGATADANETTITIEDPTADVIYRFRNATAGTYTICTTANNCTGLGAYIQNGTAAQNSANFNIQSAGTTNVTAKIRANTSQTADILQIRNSTDTTSLLSVAANGDLTVDTTTFLVDATSNFVGINVAPVSALTLNGSQTISKNNSIMFNGYYSSGDKYFETDSAFQI